MDELDTIELTFDDGEKVSFYVLEQTTLMGNTYLLVVPDDEEDDECYILKDSSQTEDDGYGMYDFVDDENELESLFPIFKELLEDSDTEVEF